ncbi:MAG: tetratricopeptide repeat protein [Micropepsaceae bacterium]
MQNKTAIKWIGFVTALSCTMLLGLTQCSEFQPLQSDTKPAASNRYGSYLAGRYATGARDSEAAARYFKSALTFDPQNPALLERALLSEVSGGDIDTAANYAEDLVKRVPSARLPNLVIGIRALRDDAYAKSAQAFEKVAGNAAAEIAAKVGLAYADYAQGNLPGATDALAKLNSVGGTRAFALYHQALMEDLSGKNAEALSHYEEANRLSDGESLRILQAYGNFLARQGQAGKAKELYQTFLLKAPGNPVIQRELSRMAGGGVPTRVISDAKQGMAETLYGVAASSSDDKAVELPVFYLQLALALDPHHELSLSLLADRQEAGERWQDANDTYERIPPTSPLFVSSRQQIAQNLQKLKRPDDALKTLNQALNGTEEDAHTYAAIGDVLRDQDKYAEAAAAYTKAISMISRPEERHWTLFYTRGVSYEREKRWNDAESDLRMALKLRPQQPMVMNYLAYSWVDRGINIREGLEMLQRAVELRPDDGYVVDSLGWAHYRLGNFKAATEYLEKAVLLEPGLSTINDHLGDAYWRTGRKLEAKFQWQHALAMAPEKADEPKIMRKLDVGLEDQPKNPSRADNAGQGSK